MPCPSFPIGLFGEHVPETVLDRPPPVLRQVPYEVRRGPSRRQLLERDLDSGYIPAQREGRQLPQRHSREPYAECQRLGSRLVCHQVS